jgi:hypothetical protein
MRREMRGLAVTLAGGLFLAFSGAFGTGEAPLPSRLAYWLVLMLGGHLLGSMVARRVFGDRLHADRIPWGRVALASLAMSAPFTLVVWAATGLALGHWMAPAMAPALFLSVLAVALMITSINVLIAQRHAPVTAPAPPPKFLERLPLKLRDAEVWAVEAEDHYLRLHTSRGQDLILMRLADAVAELEGIEGMQVHRSWWIARAAIADAKRGDGRAVLTLKDGSEVPVSRTYAGELRTKGWI